MHCIISCEEESGDDSLWLLWVLDGGVGLVHVDSYFLEQLWYALSPPLSTDNHRKLSSITLMVRKASPLVEASTEYIFRYTIFRSIY